VARYPSHRLLGVTGVLVLAWLVSGGRTYGQGKASGDLEAVPVLSASRVLPPKLLRGAHYTIDDRVENDGYFNTYTIKTPFGIFRPTGRPLLEIRIREIEALGELDKLESSKVFLDAAKTTGKKVLLAPVRAAEKVVDTVSDPDKMVDTLKAVPQGAQRLFSWAARQVESAYDGASELVSSKKDQEKGARAKDKESSISASETLKQGRDLGLSFIGYNKREREWFRKLQVSPYTSNQPLKDEVTRVAAIETAVGVAFKFVPSLGLLSELDTFNTWYSRAEKLALYEEPDGIRGKARAELVALGVSEV